MLHIKYDALWEQVTARLRYEMHTYIAKSKLQSIVIGESGGIDSALTTALVRPVCDSLGIPLIGRSITIETNTIEERMRAQAIGETFCSDFREVDLTDLYHTTVATIDEECIEDITSRAYRLRVGNIKARLRMIYLFNLAQKHRGMVMSTDNYTEFMLGFWTLHGDVGDYNPLYGLWKSEVYMLAQHIAQTLPNKEQRSALEEAIACTPTDGLGITSSDVEQLGAKNYAEVDATLIDFLVNQNDIINPTVVARHKASAFKRTNPTVILRETAFTPLSNK